MKYIFLLILLLLSLHMQSQNDEPKIKYVDGEKVYIRTDEKPEYPGGKQERDIFITHNLKYPVAAQTEGDEGRVIIRLVVTKTGNISDYEVFRSAGQLLDEEALRIAKAMPDAGWISAKLKGEPVHAYYMMPITFSIKNPEPEIYEKVDVKAEYPEGEHKMQELIRKRLRYPDKALRNGIQGRTSVRFTVLKDGSVIDHQIVKGICLALDEESIRMAKLLTRKKWKPATIDGQPVDSYYTLPLQFRIN